MDFKPVNSEHSVQSVTFTVTLDGPVPTSVVQSARLRQQLQADLPATQMAETFEFSMAGSAAVPRRSPGIQFSHLRPDGTPAWALGLAANILSVQCTRYTRWEKVWGAAQRYIEIALEFLAGVERPRKVISIGQQFVDVFVANRNEYDLKTLLKPCDLLATKAFSSGPIWHSHFGWFEPLNEEGVVWLNQLNLDATAKCPLMTQSGHSPVAALQVGHPRAEDSRRFSCSQMRRRCRRKSRSPEAT